MSLTDAQIAGLRSEAEAFANVKVANYIAVEADIGMADWGDLDEVAQRIADLVVTYLGVMPTNEGVRASMHTEDGEPPEGLTDEIISAVSEICGFHA